MRTEQRGFAESGAERILVVPETTDDLWHLSHVIEPGDLVEGDTTRRITRNDDNLRDTGGEREHIHVTLSVETVEFARFADRLRVGGEIVGASREDEIGHHHTINVEANTELVIEKDLKPDQRERLEGAADATDEPEVVIATVEEGAASVHTVREYGTEETLSITKPTGKGEYARPRSELFEELGDALARMDADGIVLAGPGFTKEDARDTITDQHPGLADRIRTVDTAGAGDRGVHEALKRGAVEEIKADTRIAREAELIDELTERIATGTKATYGPEPTMEAAEFGAVGTLLVVDESLRTERRGEGDWAIDADELVETVEQQGGDVVVFSSEFDPGRQLSNLGGVAALLRYRLE